MSFILKIAYSVLLFAVAGLAVREFWTVWFDKTVYIGKFNIISEKGTGDATNDAFARQVVVAQTILAQQLTDYQSRHAGRGPSDPTYAIPGMPEIKLPPEILAGVDITVQNVNLRQVLTAIRRGFLAPNEVTGQVTERAGSVLAAVDWPHAPALAGEALTKFLVPSRATAQEAAAYIACSISWARAAANNPDFAKFPRAQYCDYAAGLGELYALEEEASTADGLSEANTRRVRKRAAVLRSFYEAQNVFPEIYRLRADLLDLLPEQKRKQADLIDAQEARVRYAMLSADLKNLPADKKRLVAQALARPAILLAGDALQNPPENWAGILKRHSDDIQAAAAATGLIIGPDGKPRATGFIAAPGMLLTTPYVLSGASRPPGAELSASTPKGFRFCLGPSATNCTDSLKVGKILFPESGKPSALALAELHGHDPVLHPPLAIAEALPAANEMVGGYAYVIGYPFFDMRMPEDFVDHLLGKVEGRKRLMPGRMLAFGVSRDEIGAAQKGTVFTTDISTSSGTGGGPLIDYKTGKVIGVSFAGIWMGERGKFSYSTPIPKAVLKLLHPAPPADPDAQTSPSPRDGAPAN